MHKLIIFRQPGNNRCLPQVGLSKNTQVIYRNTHFKRLNRDLDYNTLSGTGLNKPAGTIVHLKSVAGSIAICAGNQSTVSSAVLHTPDESVSFSFETDTDLTAGDSTFTWFLGQGPNGGTQYVEDEP